MGNVGLQGFFLLLYLRTCFYRHGSVGCVLTAFRTVKSTHSPSPDGTRSPIHQASRHSWHTRLCHSILCIVLSLARNNAPTPPHPPPLSERGSLCPGHVRIPSSDYFTISSLACCPQHSDSPANSVRDNLFNTSPLPGQKLSGC